MSSCDREGGRVVGASGPPFAGGASALFRRKLRHGSRGASSAGSWKEKENRLLSAVPSL